MDWLTREQVLERYNLDVDDRELRRYLSSGALPAAAMGFDYETNRFYDPAVEKYVLRDAQRRMGVEKRSYPGVYLPLGMPRLSIEHGDDEEEFARYLSRRMQESRE